MCAVPPAGESRSSPPLASRRQGHLGLIGIAQRDTSLERNEDRPVMTPPRPHVAGTATATASASSTSDNVDWRPSSFFEARATGKQLQEQGHFCEALNFYRCALYHASRHREDGSSMTQAGTRSPPSGSGVPALQRAVADTLFDMGCILATRRDLVKSSEALYACLDIRRQTLPPTDASIAAVLYELALISASSDPESAVELLLEAHAILNANAAQYADSLVKVWYAIGTVQHAMGQREAAASAFQEARSLDRIIQ